MHPFHYIDTFYCLANMRHVYIFNSILRKSKCVFICFCLLYVIYQYNYLYAWNIFISLLSILELMYHYDKDILLNKFAVSSLLALSFLQINFCLLHKPIESLFVFMLLVHNSVSTILQYITHKCMKMMGFTGLQVINRYVSCISKKSFECYIMGLVCTPYVMNWIFTTTLFNSYSWYIINILGICGNLYNQSIKRSVGVDIWSDYVGSLGGINDNVNVWIIPCVHIYIAGFHSQLLSEKIVQ